MCLAAQTQTLKVLCVLYSTMCLAGWPLRADAARLRCGSDLLGDLIFVCGDRGVYLGKGKWSGYGSRPRGKGIVDQCCRPSGCDLYHLEMYCAKPKSQQTSAAPPGTSATPGTVTQTDAAQHFEALFHKRLAEHLGPPDSPKRDAYRARAAPPLRRKTKESSSSSYGRISTTRRPAAASTRGLSTS